MYNVYHVLSRLVAYAYICYAFHEEFHSYAVHYWLYANNILYIWYAHLWESE